MIDIYAVVALVGIMIGFITVIGVVIGTMLWLSPTSKPRRLVDFPTLDSCPDKVGHI